MVERIRTLLESRQLTPTQFADVIGVARPIVSHILSGRNKPSLEVVQRILAAMPDLAMPWLLNGTGPMLAGASAAAGPPMSSEAADVPVPVRPVAPASGATIEAHPVVVDATIEVPLIPVHGREHTEKESVSYAAPKVTPLRASIPGSGRTRAIPKRFVANAAPLGASPQLPASAQFLSQPSPVTPEQPPAVAPVQDTTASPSIPTSTPITEVSDAAVPLQPAPADDTPGAALASALFAGGDKPIRRIVIFYRDGSFADYQPE
jgi:transcriptional regulator with XRE-family HTH domain